MNILITGATGFLGKNLLKFLKENLSKEHKVYLLTSHLIEGFDCILHKGYSYDKSELPENIDVLLSLSGFVPKNDKDHNDKYNHASAVVNLNYLLNNLPNIPQKVIFCSSVEVYGRNNADIINEESKIFATNLYSAQKLMCEGIVEQYAIKNRCSYHILRLGPMFGANDIGREHLFLPNIFKKAITNKPIHLVAPNNKRNYIYVKDVACAIYKSLFINDDVPIINIVSENNMTMHKIATSIIHTTNSKSIMSVENEDVFSSEQMIYDNSKIKKYLCGETYSFESAVKEIYQIWREQI